MAKVKNAGAVDYTGPALEIAAGEVAEVTDAQAAYLCSDDSPGTFELVKDEAPKGKK